MVHKSYIHLEFHFCTFCDFKNRTFTTCNCCISTVFVLPNHSGCLTCLASVVALVNASVSVAAMEGFSATNSSANAPTSKCHWPHSATNHRVAELILGGVQKKMNKNTMITWWQKPPWKGPFCIEIDSGPGYLEPSTLHMFWRELKHFATKELLWCSWEPIVFLMLANNLAYIFTLCSCWFEPPADSGPSVQPSNQIKNQRGNFWRTTFPDNDYTIQIRFQTCMALGLSNQQRM